MKKGLKIALISILGFCAVLFAALHIVLNSKVTRNAIDKLAAGYVDGRLDYSRLRISLLPALRLSLDSLSLTYPHGRFPEDSSSYFTLAGCGTVADTLLALDRLSLKMRLLPLLGGKVSVKQLEIDGPRAFLHQYDSLSSNLDILKMPESDSDGSSEPSLALSLGKMLVSGRPHFIMDRRATASAAAISFHALELAGSVKMHDSALESRGLNLGLDSLRLYARTACDTLDCGNCLKIEQSGASSYKIDFASDIFLALREYGRMYVPAVLRGELQAGKLEDRIDLATDDLRAELAFLPLELRGRASICPDSTLVNASLRLDDCPLDSVRLNYAVLVMPALSKLSTDARISADLSLDGCYSDHSYPEINACLQIPESRTTYIPENLTLELAVDLDAVLHPDGVLNAEFHEFRAGLPGVEVDLDGEALDLLGEDPLYSLSACAKAELEKLMEIVPESLGIRSASGDIDLDLSARTRLSELANYRFDEADIRGRLRSDRLALSMAGDSVNAAVFKSAVDLQSDRNGLDLKVDFDSLYFNSGVQLIARVRNIRNEGHISKTRVGGRMLPKLRLSSRSERIFFKYGSGRYGLRGGDFGFTAQKVVPKEQPKKEFKIPAFLQEKDFEEADLDISLDSSFVNLLQNWSASGHIKADGGYYSSPAMPLRTRMTALHADFDDREVVIDQFGLKSGTSDINLSGYLRGVKSSLMHKDMLNVFLMAESERINLNEIISAILAGEGSDASGNVTVDQELDESFVTDTLADATVAYEDIPLIVVPGNVNLTLKMNAERVDLMEPRIGPFSSGIKIKDRTMQLLSTDIATDIGDINLDAFYATRTKKDISAGVNLNLTGMQAGNIIALIPAVDSLMPALKAFDGKLWLELSATSQLDTNMNVIVPTLDGVVRVSGEDLRVHNTGQLGTLATRLLFGRKDYLSINNLHADAIIHDSRIELFPFELGTDKLKLALRGSQGFDNSMYYHASVIKSPVLLRFGVNVYGSTDNWHFSLGRAKYRDGNVPAYTEQLDTVQLNLASSIRNIFRRGVDNVLRHNTEALAGIDSESARIDPLHPQEEDFSAIEMAEYIDMVDNYVYEQELEDQQEALNREVEEALADTVVDMSSLLSQYENDIYDRRLMRKMERAKRRDARKAAR